MIKKMIKIPLAQYKNKIMKVKTIPNKRRGPFKCKINMVRNNRNFKNMPIF